VAAAIDRDPEIVENLADIMIMGGAVDVGGSVEPAYRAEWNLWADPVAANRVLRSGVPITLVPLDATNAVPASVVLPRRAHRAEDHPGGRAGVPVLRR
jgi:inosine-uridine nucleoside N-ribohydrolase